MKPGEGPQSTDAVAGSLKETIKDYYLRNYNLHKDSGINIFKMPHFHMDMFEPGHV